MSSLRSLLNPENGHPEPTDPVEFDPQIPPSPASIQGVNTSVDRVSDGVNSPQDHQVAPHDHEPHPNCPDTLDCLPDTNGRPQHTLPVILRCAILGSPRKRLTIREIYAAMEGKYAYYRTAGSTWKQSVRHHLSLNRLFERQPRPVTDPGFGSYWTVNLDAPPGTKRPRKRGSRNKQPIPTLDTSASAASKGRGRPRKESSDSQHIRSPDKYAGDEDDYEMSVDLGGESPHLSEEEDDGLETEEEHLSPYERRSYLAGGSHGRSSSSTSPTYDRPKDGDNAARNIIDMQEIELTTMRRQSADAIQLSMRLSEQLSQAQAEASRARATLKAVEAMLADETKKRREAESALEHEQRLRRSAEQALRHTHRTSTTPSPPPPPSA